MENEYVDYEEVNETVQEPQTEESKLVEMAKNDEDFARAFMRLHTPLNATKLPGRNDICPFCNSGKKFKKCECYDKYKVEYTNKYTLQ